MINRRHSLLWLPALALSHGAASAFDLGRTLGAVQSAGAAMNLSDNDIRNNAQGELFVAEHEAALPLFIGPDEDSASMLARHLEWSDLLAPTERQINKLVLTRRQAWQLQLDDGTRLELGREEEKSPIAERLARYVNTQPEILRRGAQKVIYADLRYPNGYAIRMSSTEHQDRP